MEKMIQNFYLLRTFCILSDRYSGRLLPRPDEDKATGVVVWDVEVSNQNDDPVAVYNILTLVERRED